MQGVKVEVFRHRLPKEGSGALDETNVWKATAGLSGQEHKGTSARNEVFGSIRQIPLTSAPAKTKNAACAFYITCRILSLALENSWKN